MMIRLRLIGKSSSTTLEINKGEFCTRKKKKNSKMNINEKAIKDKWKRKDVLVAKYCCHRWEPRLLTAVSRILSSASLAERGRQQLRNTDGKGLKTKKCRKNKRRKLLSLNLLGFSFCLSQISLSPFQHFLKRELLKFCFIRHVVRICMKSGHEIWRLDEKLVLWSCAPGACRPSSLAS